MKTGFAVLLLLAVSCPAQEDAAPTNELAFGLGGILASARKRFGEPERAIGTGVSSELRAPIPEPQRGGSLRRDQFHGQPDARCLYADHDDDARLRQYCM